MTNNKQIAKVREKIAKQLNGGAVFSELSEEQEESLIATLSPNPDYGEIRRINNERELEAVKKLLAGYMFNEHVIVRGTEITKNGDVREVSLSHFDVMMKATRLYLETMNIQNKIWGLYNPPAEPAHQPPDPEKLKRMSIAMVHELQKIARKELPAPAMEAEIVDNGAKK